jgi:hypothetical protein
MIIELSKKYIMRGSCGQISSKLGLAPYKEQKAIWYSFETSLKQALILLAKETTSSPALI